MSRVAAEISPFNCRWITWKGALPFCTHPSTAPHGVIEAECSICELWEDTVSAVDRETPRMTPPPVDPLSRETCPICHSHDVVLVQQDALVQSFVCSICHQRWLATRPWPLLRETRFRDGSR